MRVKPTSAASRRMRRNSFRRSGSSPAVSWPCIARSVNSCLHIMNASNGEMEEENKGKEAGVSGSFRFVCRSLSSSLLCIISNFLQPTFFSLRPLLFPFSPTHGGRVADVWQASIRLFSALRHKVFQHFRVRFPHVVEDDVVHQSYGSTKQCGNAQIVNGMTSNTS